MTLDEFKKIIRQGEEKGEIKTSQPLTDLDLEIQWAIGQIGDKRGYPCNITIDEIYEEIQRAKVGTENE